MKAMREPLIYTEDLEDGNTVTPKHSNTDQPPQDGFLWPQSIEAGRNHVLLQIMQETDIELPPVIETTHGLPFETAPWFFGGEYERFRVGTVEGLFGYTGPFIDILSIVNNEPGNGHFTDVLEWFYNSCLRDERHLRILHVWNGRFKKHLVEKRNFCTMGPEHVIKHLDKIRKEWSPETGWKSGSAQNGIFENKCNTPLKNSGSAQPELTVSVVNVGGVINSAEPTTKK